MADTNSMSPEQEAMLAEWRKKATPAHLAQYVTRHEEDDVVWRPFEHLLYVNDLLVDACTDTNQRFLNISLSVRHGKSWLTSIYLAVWYLGMYPDRTVAVISYNETKAKDWGRATRDIMTAYGPELFGITVDQSNSSKTEWSIKGRRGRFIAAGVDGSLTGVGIDLCIIDDPIKNRQEASSPGALEAVYAGYKSNIRTRLGSKGTMILTMARWAPEDLAGCVLEASKDPEADQWEEVNLPAMAEAPPGEDPETWRDQIGRKDGDPLCPEIRSKDELLRVKATVGPLDWESLWQQRPNPPGGTMFKVDKWMHAEHVDERTLRIMRCWDLAATEGAGDWTVGVKMGLDADNRVYILDVVRFRKEARGVKKEVLATAKRDGINVPIAIEQERAGAGKAQLSDMKRLLFGYNVEALKPEGTKAQRAAPYASQQQDSNVYIVGSPDWKDAFVEEHRIFTGNGIGHDDQVDAASGAFNKLAEMAPASIVGFEEHVEVPLGRMMELGMGGARQEFNIPVG